MLLINYLYIAKVKVAGIMLLVTSLDMLISALFQVWAIMIHDQA